MKRLQSRWALIVTVICTALGFAVTPAGASGTTAASTGSAGTVQITVASSGKVVTLPANWQTLPVAQLAKYGLTPNMPAPNNPGAAATVRASHPDHPVNHGGVAKGGGVTPMSAANWNGNVFISITGSGLWVDEWYTQTTTIPGYFCTFAAYWAPTVNTLWATGQERCGTDAIFYDYYTQLQFQQDSQACNTWIGLTGDPCIYVYQ